MVSYYLEHLLDLLVDVSLVKSPPACDSRSVSCGSVVQTILDVHDVVAAVSVFATVERLSEHICRHALVGGKVDGD